MDVAALPLPGTQVTHPALLLLAAIVLAATMLFWVGTGRRGRGDTRDERRRGGEDGRRRSRGPLVTVNVDPVRCERFGYCEQEAPQVFQLRREGRLTYQDRVPVDDVEAVGRAVEVCPARAISLGPMPRR